MQKGINNAPSRALGQLRAKGAESFTSMGKYLVPNDYWARRWLLVLSATPFGRNAKISLFIDPIRSDENANRLDIAA